MGVTACSVCCHGGRFDQVCGPNSCRFCRNCEAAISNRSAVSTPIVIRRGVEFGAPQTYEFSRLASTIVLQGGGDALSPVAYLKGKVARGRELAVTCREAER